MRIIATLVPTLLLVCILFWPHSSEAVVSISGDTLTVNPAAPGPRAQATVSVSDHTQLPSGTSVRWFVDGVEMTENQDDASLTIMTKGSGEETRVEMSLYTPGGQERTATASIVPTRLDLVVGSDSSVPYFYKGRALPGKQSRISVQAFLFGENSGPYRYRWVVNGREELSEVGGARDQLILTPNFNQEMNVYVEITNLNGDMVAQGGTVIPLVAPEVHFYEANPLHGLIPVVIASPFYFLNDEITLRAEPYYFSGPQSGYAITWKVDGQKVASDEDPLELSLMKTKEAGQARIGLDVINTNNYIETAKTELQLTY